MKTETKVFIETQGDMSVGIPSITITVSGLPHPVDDENRRLDKLTLRDCFEELLDDYVRVRFEDECPDCEHLEYDGTLRRCKNSRCISNIPEID